MHLTPSTRLIRHFAAVGAALLVLAGHFWMIEAVGSPVPIHDQWQAEAEHLFLPATEHRLTLGYLLLPNGEHRIVPTRLLALALFDANDHRWDVRLQMTANAFLAAAFVGLVVCLAAAFLTPMFLVVFATFFGGLFASPLFYGNTLWGFQSQFYFLLLFSVLHLALVLRHAPGTLAWFLGMICSLLACVSMGSGFFSAAIAQIIFAWLIYFERGPGDRRNLRINLAVHLAICATAVAFRPSAGAPPSSWADCVHTLLHCLSWPARFFTPTGAWIWCPFVLLLGLSLVRRSVRHHALPLAIGGWVLAQMVAISWARSAPALVITPRYYEIFWLGLAANALALACLWKLSATTTPFRVVRFALIGLALGWSATVAWRSFSFAQSHLRYDLATMKSYRIAQVTHLRRFLNSDDLANLQSESYPRVPHPDPIYLAQLLRNPTVRSFLPVELNDQPSATLSRFGHTLRLPVAFYFASGLAALLIAATLADQPRR